MRYLKLVVLASVFLLIHCTPPDVTASQARYIKYETIRSTPPQNAPHLPEFKRAATELAKYDIVVEPAPVVEARPPKPQPRIRTMWVLVRGYTPWDKIDSRSKWRDGRTAWPPPKGKNTRIMPHCWGVAVNPKVFPFGTKIRIPGYKPSKNYDADHWWEADDTGGVIRQAYIGGWVRGTYYKPGTVIVEGRCITDRYTKKITGWKTIEYILPEDQK